MSPVLQSRWWPGWKGAHCRSWTQGWPWYPGICSGVFFFSDWARSNLVGGFNPSEKYEFVSWNDYSQHFWENKSHVPVTTNQLSLIYFRTATIWQKMHGWCDIWYPSKGGSLWIMPLKREKIHIRLRETTNESSIVILFIHILRIPLASYKLYSHQSDSTLPPPKVGRE